MEPMGRVKGLGVSGFGVSELMLLGCITLFFDGQWGGVGWGGGVHTASSSLSFVP